MTTLEGGGLWAFLQTRPGLTGEVGDRIYPRRLPRDVTFPAIVYSRVSTARGATHDGPDGLPMPRFQFDIWGKDPDSVDAAAEQLRLAIDGYRGAMGDVTVGSALVVGDVDGDDPETGLYRRIVDVQVQHEEAVA